MRWITGIGIVAVGIGAAIATASKRGRRAAKSRGLGAIDPFDATFNPENASRQSEPAFYKPPKKDEPGGCLLIGRKHQAIKDTNEYRVCLTPTQEQTLLGGKKIGKKLGCGVFACAYALGKSKVVKFTRDQDDVAALLEAQNTGVVPKIYEVYKLKQGGEMPDPAKPYLSPQDVPVFALVLERLKTLPVPKRKILDAVLYQTPDVVGGYATREDVCASAGPEAPICEQVVDVAKKLDEIGIKWSDVHAGNIGLDRKGNVKALDLGVSKTELKRRIDVLEGRRAPRPIKRKLQLVP